MKEAEQTGAAGGQVETAEEMLPEGARCDVDGGEVSLRIGGHGHHADAGGPETQHDSRRGGEDPGPLAELGAHLRREGASCRRGGRRCHGQDGGGGGGEPEAAELGPDAVAIEPDAKCGGEAATEDRDGAGKQSGINGGGPGAGQGEAEPEEERGE